MHDPWLRQLRHAPEADARSRVMPGLAKLIGDFTVTGDVKIRPADLYVSNGHRQAGIVLVGDAFATSCPAAGTGAGKVFIDVERLCNVHIPQWLASAGMGEEKIAAFYDDPVKRAFDDACVAKAYYLRSYSIENGLSWRTRRFAKFGAQLAVGLLRQMRERGSSSLRAARAQPPAAARGHNGILPAALQADVAQRQSANRPGWRRGFNSFRPLQFPAPADVHIDTASRCNLNTRKLLSFFDKSRRKSRLVPR